MTKPGRTLSVTTRSSAAVLDNPVPYDIPKTDILAALDYGAGSIRGLMRAADEADVPKFRRLLKKRGGLP
jgi:hypothetical protein